MAAELSPLDLARFMEIMNTGKISAFDFFGSGMAELNEGRGFGSGVNNLFGQTGGSAFDNLSFFPNGGGEFVSGSGPLAIVLAAILAQTQFSNATDTTFEGQETGDLFDSKPSFATDPFLGFVSDKLGLQPTQGEKIDAAIKNKDFGLAAKRIPAGVDIGSDISFNVIEKFLGKDAARIANPLQGFLKELENIF